MTKEQEILEAYQAGQDKLRNGANEENCNFRFFSSHQKTKAWEFGAEGKSFSLEDILKAAL